VSHQRCLAWHTSNPPTTLGELKLCESHYHRLTDALTGPSILKDPTAIDATWGVRAWGGTASHPTYDEATRAWNTASDRWLSLSHLGRMPLPALVVYDGTAWCAPADYRPGGITRDWAALELREKHLHTGEPAPFVHGTADPAIPIDSAVADIRLRITHALGYWIREHVTHQQLTQPTPATVHQSTSWLARYTDWAAKQHWAGRYVDNLLELRNRARRTIDLPAPRRLDVGPCPAYVDGHRCAGLLFTIARDAGDSTPPVIQCSLCPAAYDSTQWKNLGKRLARRQDRAA
jgi:hypothetical protein